MARQRALVLGGYGLIGSSVMRALAGEGYDVVGLGRSQMAAERSDPDASWIIRDLTRMARDDWAALLSDVDVVVNAAGALQDGAEDDLHAIHVGMVESFLAAAEGLPLRIIQISAAGAEAGASTAFLRTKAQGDALVAGRALDWVILRPVLVLSSEAYGGTALLRAAVDAALDAR